MFTKVKIHVEVVWIVIQINVVVGHRRYRGLRCLHLDVDTLPQN